MRTRQLIACGLAALVLLVVGCGDDDNDGSGNSAADSTQQADRPNAVAPPPKEKPHVTPPEGAPPTELEVEDLVSGQGRAAKAGDEVTVNYVGVGYKTKKEFDTSFGKEPFVFPLGAGQVIPGWDKGIVGMKVGGRRQLLIPAKLAYGAQGRPPAIEPNEALVFIVDLIDVK
jgi:peptidylprolyl isomerase